MAGETATSEKMKKNAASETSQRKSASEEQKRVGLNFASLQKFFTKFNNDWSMTFAGTLAYSLLMAVVPIMLAILSILGFVLGSDLRTWLLDTITNSLPGLSSQRPSIEYALKQFSEQAGYLGLFAILTAIFGGSRLFLAIEGCLNIVYRVRPRTIIPQNIMAISMLLLFIVLVPIMILMGTLPAFLLQTVSNYPLLQHIPFFSWLTGNFVTTYLISFLGGLLAAFLLFTAIYMVVPNQHIKLRNSLPGALVAAVAIEIFLTIVFPFYTTRFMGGYNYAGQAGFVVILLVFFYYAAVILMLGAEVNAFFFEGVQPIPNDLATFVSTMAGKLKTDLSPDESSPHANPQPTENADDAYIAKVREQEEEIKAVNQQKEHRLWHRASRRKAEKLVKQSKKPGMSKTLLEVLLGSVLAMVIRLFQTRRRGRA